MDQDTLSKLTLSELKLLCSNRELDTKGRIAKQTLINKLLSYNKKNSYKKLKFEKNLREWKKDELVLELRARGTKSGNRNKQHIAYKLMHNGQSPNKKKTKSVLNQSNQKMTEKSKLRKKSESKPRKKSKLKQKEEKMMKAYKSLEAVNQKIWIDLQNGFKPVNLETKLPHQYNDFDDKVEIPEDLGDELDSFGDKLLELLPLILEIHSISNDYIKYKNKIKKKQQGTKENIYYVGMKKYKKKKHYNQDEIGPICGVFQNLKEFDQFKDDSSVKKQFGKKIARIRYLNSITKQQNKNNDNSNDSENDDDDIEMPSETEQKISDNDDISDDESLSDDGIISTDEDEDTQHQYITNDNHDDDVAEIVITTEDDIKDDDMDDIEISNDENKNKNKTRNRNKSREVSKKPAMTKNTRSRREANKNKKVSGRKRRRDNNNNEDDELTENPKKKLKVNPISG
mmetsp:Transcript_32485/g.28505  ORF Transcript_32485/g.28505 Transcript_32485/m.28505 type:complete len:456 (+) Transcript_32485:160-1527(+)